MRTPDPPAEWVVAQTTTITHIPSLAMEMLRLHHLIPNRLLLLMEATAGSYLKQRITFAIYIISDDLGNS